MHSPCMNFNLNFLVSQSERELLDNANIYSILNLVCHFTIILMSYSSQPL